MGRDNKLSLIRPTGIKTDYSVTIKYYLEDRLEEDKRLDFSVSIEYLKKLEDHYLVRIIKSDFFLDRKEPTLIVEQIAKEINDALYPMDLLVSFEGNFEEVNNMDAIAKRWKARKEKLNQHYKGEVIQSIIDKTDSVLSRQLKFEISLSNDMFFPVFFNPNYVSYGENLKLDMCVQFPIEPYSLPLEHHGTSSINSFLSTHNTVEINYNGTGQVPKTSNLYHNSHADDVLESLLDIKYDLDEKNHIPLWIRTSCTVYEQTERKPLRTIESTIVKQNNNSKNVRI